MHTKLANGDHAAKQLLHTLSQKSTTWRSAQCIISAHLQQNIRIAHPVHLTLQVLLYSATFNEIHEQQFTSVLPLLSLIINLLRIKVQVTNNYSKSYLTAASPTAHFNNPRFYTTIQYCQLQHLISSTSAAFSSCRNDELIN